MPVRDWDKLRRQSKVAPPESRNFRAAKAARLAYNKARRRFRRSAKLFLAAQK